jgi:hypothetical protein
MTKLRIFACSKTFAKETNTVISALTVLVVAACQPTTAPATTSTRVDVLNQANAAFAQGDFAQASGLYERVVNTPPTGEARDTTLTIDDFARFRDAVSLLALGREDDAKAQVDALQQADSNAALARLGAQLWDQYGMTGSLRAACAQMQPDIASQAAATASALNGVGVTVDTGKLCS